MITEIEIKNYFSIAKTKIELTEQVKSLYGKELSPNFNSFDFWRLDENKVSSIISFFLNPNEFHEHGDIYLKHFIQKFNLDFFEFENIKDIKVHCEFITYEGRRIDILIENENLKQIIAIENKIYNETADQKNQITDYINFLEKKLNNNKFCLIYLSPQNKQISNDSINDDDKIKFINTNQLKLISYEEHMIDCISDFHDLTQNLRVKSFLKDFEKKLKKMYMGEKNINSRQIIADLIDDNEKNLEISFLVSNSLNEVKNKLKMKFEEQIKEIGDELKIEVNGLNLTPSKWKNNTICFSYELGGIIFGLKRNKLDNNQIKYQEILDNIKDELGEDNFKVSGWWSCYKLFYNQIDNNDQFWLDIKSGKAKERAKKFAQLICENFDHDTF